MSNIWWRTLGFKDSPYQTLPLGITKEDSRLFIGRKKESDTFLNLVDTSDGCVIIISGEVGVGKTSFLNINQFRMVERKNVDIPKLIPSIKNYTLDEGHDARTIAQMCVHNTVINVIDYSDQRHLNVPSQIMRIEEWLSHKATRGGLGLTLSILGFGGGIVRSVVIPPVSEATIINWRDIIAVIASECVCNLKVDGVIVCIDNTENVGCAELARIMMAFRDTMFMVKNVRWIVVGQSKLYARLNAQDRRISQRIKGRGIEIPPMTANELHEVIDERIKRYRADEQVVSPLSEAIHKRLFAASRGVVRFMLHTADTLIGELIADIKRPELSETNHNIKPALMDVMYKNALSKVLVEKHFPDKKVEKKLADMAAKMIAESEELELEDVDFLEFIDNRDVKLEELIQANPNLSKQSIETILDKFIACDFLEKRNIQGEEHYRLISFSYLCQDLKAFEQVRKLIKGGC